MNASQKTLVSLFKGELGFPPDGFLEELSRKALKLAEGSGSPVAYRPRDYLPSVDLAATHTLTAQAGGVEL